MAKLCLILGDQLSHSLSSLRSLNKDNDIILMCEVMDEATYVPHHKQKIAFIFSSMRHFAENLKQQGWNIHYTKIDDPQNAKSFSGEVARYIQQNQINEIVVTEAGEWRVQKFFENWRNQFKIPVSIQPDDRFLCSHDEFSKWAQNKKQLRMEFFYREMRKKYNILMNSDGTPVGGQWNFDKENRDPPPKNHTYTQWPIRQKSNITKDVLGLVEKKFSPHFGSLDHFNYAVTTEDARSDLDFFIDNCLPHFGTYQDAMSAHEPFLYHSRLSAYINIGLLNPLNVCQKAEQAYHQGKIPLNATEGFIRQILGWREYIRGIYWHFMPEYAEHNFLNATEALPSFYWGDNTDMFCIAETVRHTKEFAYSHHIQRLMVTGNFALLAGLDVKQVQEWYLSVYADAYEWVEMPNTLGMALFGDGGIVASKPYAASGKYIHKMSNYCQNCRYNPNLLLEDTACPFNSLYWNFIDKHAKLLNKNQRMAYVYMTWNKFSDDKKDNIRKKADQILIKMREGCL